MVQFSTLINVDFKMIQQILNKPVANLVNLIMPKKISELKNNPLPTSYGFLDDFYLSYSRPPVNCLFASHLQINVLGKPAARAARPYFASIGRLSTEFIDLQPAASPWAFLCLLQAC